MNKRERKEYNLPIRALILAELVMNFLSKNPLFHWTKMFKKIHIFFPSYW